MGLEIGNKSAKDTQLVSDTTEMNLRHADSSCSRDPALPLLIAPLGSWLQKTPSRCPCTWAGHFLREALSLFPLWALGFFPPSYLCLCSAPGAGLGLPASLLLPGTDSPVFTG